jgi:hypothetical protein
MATTAYRIEANVSDWRVCDINVRSNLTVWRHCERCGS